MRSLLALCLLACACLDAPPDVCVEPDVSQEAKLKIRGLYTSLSPTDAPEGALSQADDVVIRRDSTLEPRRGVANYGDTKAMNRLFPYRSSLFGHSSTGTISRYIAGTWTALSGSYPPPDTTVNKTRTAEAAGNLYFTTSTGLYFLDSATATPVLAGVPKPTSLDRERRVATAPIGGLVRTTNVVAATTSAAHGFYVGQVVNMNSAGEANFANGNKTVATVGSTTTFTYAETGADLTSTASQTFLPASLVATGGFLTDGNQVAYRATINAPDANNILKESAPSSRQVVPNASTEPGYGAGVARNVVARILLPSGVAITDYVRLYRSKQVATTVEPSEEMGLVWEALIKTGDITNGYVDVTDIATDALRGATGYFSPSQDGEAQANEPPPLANDIALFHGSMFFAATTGPHRFEMSLLGVGGATGLEAGTKLQCDKRVYTPVTGAPTTALTFKMETSGSGAQNIRDTALALVAVINRDTANNSRAYYLSGQNDLPGKILLERKALGGAAFYPYTNKLRTCWSPLLNSITYGFGLSRTGTTVTATADGGLTHNYLVGETVTLAVGDANFPAGDKVVVTTTSTTFTYTESGAATTLADQDFTSASLVGSSNDAAGNRLYWSRTDQHEAVPLLNYLNVGSSVYSIKRIVALRDTLFVFKSDGIFKVTGDNGVFSVALFDPTVHLVSPDTAVALGNRVFGLATVGVVAVSETGVELVSGPINSTLLELLAKNSTNVLNTAFGVGYESESTYELRVPSTSGSTPSQAFLYDTLTNSWGRDTITANHGVIDPADGKRYLAGATFVLQERKGLVYSDYSDADLAITITSAPAGNSLTVTSSTGVAAGDIVDQGGNVARVTAVPDGTHITISETVQASGIAGGAATVRKAIASAVTWLPVFGGSPGSQKLWRAITFPMGDAHLPAATVTTQTELTAAVTQTVDGAATVGQWTTAAGTWDGTERPFNLSLAVPQESRRSARLAVGFAVTAAWAHWTIQGLEVDYAGGSGRVSR